MSGGFVADVEAVLASGGDVDDTLRAVVARLAGEPGISWAGIAFVEGAGVVLGPSAGVPDEPARTRLPVLYDDDPVAELWVDGEPDRATLERVCELIAEPCLVGWDTGGEAWDA